MLNILATITMVIWAAGHLLEGVAYTFLPAKAAEPTDTDLDALSARARTEYRCTNGGLHLGIGFYSLYVLATGIEAKDIVLIAAIFASVTAARWYTMKQEQTMDDPHHRRILFLLDVPGTLIHIALAAAMFAA